MLDIIFIILAILTILLMFYAISERSSAFTVIAATLWFILALFVLQGIEIPYEMYNATSGNIETNIHNIQENLSPLAYLFMLFGTIMFILFVTYTMETLSDYRKIK
jgi:formate hydrogenlyase subunit 3/multisubunit Na+/H+ antiporter MnhD subunit